MTKISCTDGVKRTHKEYIAWLANLQDLAILEPEDLTCEEWLALEKEGLIY